MQKKAVEVCKEHNLHPVMICKWKKEFNQNPMKSFSGNGNLLKVEAEAEKYKRLVGELYAEIDFLKKNKHKADGIKGRRKKGEIYKMISEKQITIERACYALDLSKSSYYKWKDILPLSDNDKCLRQEIQNICSIF